MKGPSIFLSMKQGRMGVVSFNFGRSYPSMIFWFEFVIWKLRVYIIGPAKGERKGLFAIHWNHIIVFVWRTLFPEIKGVNYE